MYEAQDPREQQGKTMQGTHTQKEYTFILRDPSWIWWATMCIKSSERWKQNGCLGIQMGGEVGTGERNIPKREGGPYDVYSNFFLLLIPKKNEEEAYTMLEKCSLLLKH